MPEPNASLSAFIEAACVPLDGSHTTGTLERAEAILAAHPDLADQSVYAAAILGDDAAVRRFLASDPVNATAKGGPRFWDALTHLCFSRFLRLDRARSDGFVRAASALLDAGASANTGWYETNHQPRPVWGSALYGAAGVAHHAGLTRLLLERGADPNDEEVISHLRARGAHCDLCTASHIGDLARVKELLDEDPSLANRPSDYVTYYACSGTAICNAAAAGHLEIVKLLLERGADPNLPEEGIAPRGHALYSAATNGHFEVAKLLLQRGAHPNVEVESSADTLSRVISNGDQKMLELLCSYGAARAVYLLAHYNDLQTAAAVFAVNPALADDPDALGSAASEAFVRLTLRYQPDLPKRVTVAKSREVSELLFAHGMDPSRPDWLGITALHEFARKGDAEKATIFLDHGADLHARDADICSTPLGWAAKFGQKPMVEFLLERGAKPNLPDDPPWATPLAWATRRSHAEIAELLKRHGAK